MNVFIFDVNKCFGCYSCQISCKDEHCGNDWMPYAKPQPETGQFWGKIVEHVKGNRPHVKVSYTFEPCMHCDEAACMTVCMVEAITKRDDGLVVIDPKLCNGCRLCVEACPYGSIYFNQALNLAQKCTGCAHLLDRTNWTLGPRCADVCMAEAIKFGDETAFSADIAAGEVMLPDKGTKPRVYYKNLPGEFIAGTVYDPATKKVVKNATCTLSGDGTSTTTTDNFGDFWFKGLTEGTYTVTILADGKTKTIENIDIVGSVGLGDIALS